MQFQRRFLEIDQSETRIVYGGHFGMKWAILLEDLPWMHTKFRFIWLNGFREDF
jgi:hypothetical protein